MQYNKIQNSEYEIRYRELYTIGISEYLRKQWHKNFQKIIVKFRRENEELCNKFWREKDKNICKLCHIEIELIYEIWH